MDREELFFVINDVNKPDMRAVYLYYIYDDVNKASDNVVSDGKREVGGESMFRIYEIGPDAEGSIRFVIHSSLESENAEEWGSFVIDCDRLTVSDESATK